MPKYLVETVSMFRHRFVIDCDNMDLAKDTVLLEDVEEFSQTHIDENIFSCREITDEEIPVLYFNDHPYMESSWGPEQAFKYVHKVEDDEQG